MCYVVRGKGRSWEIRESRSTPRGPRSRTLATFRELSPEIVERALERAASPTDAKQIEHAARRAGAPVALSKVDRAARDLVAELARGARPRGAITRLVLELSGGPKAGLSDAARAAAAWVATPLDERARALQDLLLLADALPPSRAERAERFPRIDSAAA
jgi:hypothetical protein